MTFESDDKTVFAPAAGDTGDSVSVKLADGRSFEFQIAGGQVTVGRALDSDLVLEDAGVSRRHALLIRQAETLVIEDQGSSNGVVVNGRAVQRMELEDGDEIVVGGCTLKLSRALPEEFEDRTVVSNASVPPVRASGGGRQASGKGKKLILVGGVAGLVVLLLIILIASMGGDDKGGKAPAAKPVASAEPVAEKAAKPEPPKPAAPEKQVAKAEPSKSQAEKTWAEPKAEPVKVSAEDKAAAEGHVDQGRIMQEADRLLEAKKEYARALELDPGNKLAKSRLASVSGMIKSQAQDAYARGLKNYGFLKYQEAIHDWVRVLNLVPEKDDPLHQKAAEYIEKAKNNLKQ